MKKNILFLVVLSLLTACSFNIPLQDEASGLEVIASEEVAQEFLSGAYAAVPQKHYMALSVLAGDFYRNKNMYNTSSDYSRELNQLYRWDIRNLKEMGDDCWSSYYQGIQIVNMLLGAEEAIKVKSVKWNEIKAKALSLKAFIYLELLSLYSENYDEDNLGIVLRKSFDYDPKGRSTAKESVAEIKKLLDESLSLQNEKKRSTNYLDYYATLLLKARLALYAKDYVEAIESAEQIKNDIGYAVNNPSPSKELYAALWTDAELNAKSCPEKLFSFSREKFDFLLKPYYENLASGDYIALHKEFEFSDSDYRKNIASIAFSLGGNEVDLIGKYRKDLQDVEPKDLNVLRLAECYFILAESYLHKDKNIEKAKEILNEFLTYRNAELLSETLSFEEMDKKILFEKQKEFLGEGLNFFDIKRRNKDVQLYDIDKNKTINKIDASDYRFIWPIPLQEIKESKNLVKQNRSWPSL